MSPFLSLEKQYKLLQKEYETEKAAFQRDTELMGIDRKVKRGDCWYPVSVGRGYYNSLDRFVVEILRTADDDIEHNFEYGKQVSFFCREGNGRLTHLPFACTVSYAEADRMVVELPGEAAFARLQALDLVGVQLSFDDYSYRVMFDALRHAIEARKGRLAELRDLFHSPAPLRFGPTARPDCACPGSTPRKSRPCATCYAPRTRSSYTVRRARARLPRWSKLSARCCAANRR